MKAAPLLPDAPAGASTISAERSPRYGLLTSPAVHSVSAARRPQQRLRLHPHRHAPDLLRLGAGRNRRAGNKQQGRKELKRSRVTAAG